MPWRTPASLADAAAGDELEDDDDHGGDEQ
jgi:hypothetical protein